jgi:hypothetical protein
MSPFETFSTWSALLDAIDSGKRIYYQAPLDYQAHAVKVRILDNGKVRVTPPAYSDADSFTADVFHLERFKVTI